MQGSHRLVPYVEDGTLSRDSAGNIDRQALVVIEQEYLISSNDNLLQQISGGFCPTHGRAHAHAQHKRATHCRCVSPQEQCVLA